jgi:excisionase family DNA binding protein
MENLAKVERTTLTMRETAEYLGISYWLVNQLVRRREIPCARVGGRVLFRVQALDEYLKEKEEKSLKYQERR